MGTTTIYIMVYHWRTQRFTIGNSLMRSCISSISHGIFYSNVRVALNETCSDVVAIDCQIDGSLASAVNVTIDFCA